MSLRFLPIVTSWPSICSGERQQAQGLGAHALESDWLHASPSFATFQPCDLEDVTTS